MDEGVAIRVHLLDGASASLQSAHVQRTTIHMYICVNKYIYIYIYKRERERCLIIIIIIIIMITIMIIIII